MDKKNKHNYDPPKVTSVVFRVEDGLQASLGVRAGGLLEDFRDASWDDPSTSSTTGLFGDGDWTGGSSFSNNNSFGSDTWNN